MSFIDDAKQLVADGEVKKKGFDLVADTIDALLGNPVAAGKVIMALSRTPFFLRDKLFWKKVEQYLNGVYVEEADRAKLRAKLMEEGSSEENTRRLVECIDRAETSRKVQYLINATRCLLTDFIDRTTFFRICRAITNSLDEDLQYLREHLGESDIPYNDNIQGLYSAGLMHASILGEDPKYSFTPIAFDVDRYGVSYGDVERYPNPKGEILHLPPKMEIPTAIDEEIEELLDDAFQKPSKIRTAVEIPIEEI